MLVRLGENKALGNPFGNCGKVEFNAQMNYSAKYTDIMLYKKQDEKQTSSAA